MILAMERRQRRRTIDDEDKIKLLPDTVDGLQKRFKKLYCKFMRHNQHQHRDELVFLLDELLRQDAISREIYTQLNYMLAQSLDGSKDENDDDDDEELVFDFRSIPCSLNS